MRRERRTLADAARAYCAERDAIAALTRQLSALRCEEESAAEPEVGDPGVPSCSASITREEYTGGPVINAPVPYWEATPEELAAMCQPCQDKVALWSQRHKQTRRLAGFMTAMRRAYRHEVNPTQSLEGGGVSAQQHTGVDGGAGGDAPAPFSTQG